jgi:integrase/recombinase XerD
MQSNFERFIRERQYLSNVSPTTVRWYRYSLRWLPSESPTQDELKAVVIRMRERGVKASGCNSYLRAINAYLKWSGSPLRVPKLKEESHVPSTYTAKQVRAVVRWKPKGFFQRRIHTLMLTLFDTGVRLDEALSLRVSNCNLDDLLLTVTGKGRKERIIPFSLELRRVLAKFIMDFSIRAEQFLFSTKVGRKMSPRNALRDVKALCQRLGFTAPERSCHATRHSFACEYLRRGGSLFHLQRCLGHSSLEMVRRYAAVTVADLQAVHERVSLLSAA